MEVWCSQGLAQPRGSGWSMGLTEDPSQLCPRAETSACGHSWGHQRGIFQLEAKVAKTQRWELGWGWSWDGAGMGMKPPWGPWVPARPAQPGTHVGTGGDSDPPTAQSHC